MALMIEALRTALALTTQQASRLVEAGDFVHCTGISAVWCPVCGNCQCEAYLKEELCTCDDHYEEFRESDPDCPTHNVSVPEKFNDPRCPLHAADSKHAIYAVENLRAL